MDRELENQGMNERPAQDTLTVRVRAHDPRGEHVVKVARNVRRRATRSASDVEWEHFVDEHFVIGFFR